MNLKYTDQALIESARRFTLLADWRKAEPRHYEQAVRRGLIGRIREFLVVQTTGAKPAYTADQLAADAASYSTREEWAEAGKKAMAEGRVSPYHCALRYGPDFFKERCPHLIQRRSWTDDELVAVAAQYQHKGDWKRSDNVEHTAAYQAALARPDVFARATAHMTPKASPYAGDYVVYAYEFSDNHAYVGLTFQPAIRRSQHAQTGPVFEHAKVCQNPVYKVCQSAIMSPLEAAEAEKRWVGQYRAAGWALLNTTEAGSLGSLEPVKWDKLAVIAEARKYPTKQAWIDGSQRSYRVAKREGWFAEASVHMPKRVLGVGLGKVVSPETRQRQRAAALRRRAVVIA